MSNTKKPTFNADAAEEYFSDLLVYYRNTANDIFNRDNDGRHASNHIYSAEYQKYVGMQIAMREVLEYFSKYDLEDVQDILGDNYDLDRLREIVDADRDGRLHIFPVKIGETVWFEDPDDVIRSEKIERHNAYTCTETIGFENSDIGKYVFFSREDAEAALKGEQDGQKSYD